MIGQLTLISHNFQIVEGVHLTGENIYINTVVFVIQSDCKCNHKPRVIFLAGDTKNIFSCILMYFERKCLFFSLSLSQLR